MIAKHGLELAVIQVGQPNVFLLRKNKFTPLLITNDLTPINMSLTGLSLPRKLLGLSAHCYPQLSSFRLRENDQLLLLAHSLKSSIMDDLNSNDQSEVTLPDLFKQISSNAPTFPFWMSRIKL